MRRAIRLAAVAGGLLLAASPAAASCDRACLRAGLDTYLAALSRHAPAEGKLDRGYHATENGVAVPAGEGLWQTVTALGEVQRRYLDAKSGQAAYYGLVDESGSPAVLLLRLKFEGRKVAEAEAIVTRKGERLYDPVGVARNAPAADAADAAGRASASIASRRGALVARAQSFLDAMQNHSSAGVAHSADCVRLESGMGGRTATGDRHGCVDGFEAMVQIAAVAHRRLTLVDEPAGVVVGTLMFLRPQGATMPNGQPWKRNLVMDVFTIRDDAITGVYGATHYLEPGQPEITGWPDR